jgi:hypothetical protein
VWLESRAEPGLRRRIYQHNGGLSLAGNFRQRYAQSSLWLENRPNVNQPDPERGLGAVSVEARRRYTCPTGESAVRLAAATRRLGLRGH